MLAGVLVTDPCLRRRRRSQATHPRALVRRRGVVADQPRAITQRALRELGWPRLSVSGADREAARVVRRRPLRGTVRATVAQESRGARAGKTNAACGVGPELASSRRAPSVAAPRRL